MNPPSLDLSRLPTRLSKHVADAARLSHKQVERLWQDGKLLVRAPGESAAQLIHLQEYVFAEDEVWLDGERLVSRHATEYWLLNKPDDVVTTTSDPQGRRSLAEWLERLPAGVFPVGRLDKETTGALLLTDDGDLAHLLLDPEFHVDKIYRLEVSGEIADDDPRLEALRAGVDIGDGKELARAIAVELVSRHAEWSEVWLTLDEGRHRQIRRMCRAAKLYLRQLHRMRIGPLELAGLEVGEVRRLGEDEVEALWAASGGRALPFRRGLAALAKNAAYHRQSGRPQARVEQWIEAWRACHGDLPEV